MAEIYSGLNIQNTLNEPRKTQNSAEFKLATYEETFATFRVFSGLKSSPQEDGVSPLLAGVFL